MSSNPLVLPSPRDSRGLAVVAAKAALAASAASAAAAAIAVSWDGVTDD